MSFLGGPVPQIRKPFAEVLPDGRKRLTRWFRPTTTGEVPPELNWDPGHPDVWPDPPTGWEGLYLTYLQMDDASRGFPQGAEDATPLVRLIFEQIALTGETPIDGEDETFLPDGRAQAVKEAIQFSSQPFVPETINVSTATTDSGVVCYLFSEETDNDGTLIKIKRTFQSPGIVSTDDESLQGGALLIKKITSFHTVPSTPSGYTSVGTPVQNPNGYPIYTYTYAKGTGEVSRDISYSQSINQGTAGITRTVIRYLVVPGGSVQPTSLSGSVEIGREFQEDDGYRIWTTTWAKGTGLVQQDIRTRQDGLREVTNVALGTRSAPSGIVIEDNYRNADGYIVYTVTAMQAADGNANPATVSLAFERFVPFTYPGRAKAWVETVGSQKYLDVFLSPPVQTLVQSTVTISYTTTNTLGTISDFWNPNEWATMKATWVGAYGVAAGRNISYPGYRTTSATPVTLTSSGYNEAIFGFNIFNAATGSITVTGGPADPGGTTKTLSAEIEPAFTETTGTQWYRKSLVSSAIPAQPSLPV